jgi:hypothetical protein
VQHHVVVAELDIADLQVHVEMDLRILRQLVEQVECCPLDRRQRHAGLGAGGVDLVADQADAHQSVARAEHWQAIGRDRAFRQCRLAADVMEAAIERRQILGMPLQDLVVDGDGAHHARQPAALGAAQAEQAHDVTRIGMEGQVGAGLVAAYVDIAVAAAVVVDVAQEVSLGILGDGVAEIEPLAQKIMPTSASL